MKLEALLPAKQMLPQVPVEEVVLSEVDTSRQRSSNAHDDSMDEEEGAGPQVQCAQQ
jgi:hypothetical protein